MEKRKAQSEITSYFQKKPRSEGQASHTIPSPENATSSSLQTERLAETVHPSGSESTHVVGMPADKVFDDVGLFVRSEIKEDEKIELMKKHFRPDQNFKFPLRQYKSRNLRFVFSWLKDFPWLVYSKAKDGGYCLPCVLFARKPDGRGCTFGVLVERPFTEFRKALGKNGVLPCHQENSFHKSAVVAFDQRMQAEENPTQGIDVLIEKQRQTQFDMNKAALGSIVECIIYLGRQGLALRLVGTEERMRRAKACVFRATHPAENAKEYFRRAIAIPFIDDVISQLKSRFPDESVSAISAIMSLLPCAIKTVAVGEISDIVSDLKGYEPDLPRFGNLQTELEIWRGRWFDVKDDASCPNSLISALKACSKQSFPNVHALLQIGCVIPVTSCEAERSFSTVRRVKTVLRSTMGEERLGALVLLNSRGQSNDISVGEVVQRFINQKPRRLFSPLYELA